MFFNSKHSGLLTIIDFIYVYISSILLGVAGNYFVHLIIISDNYAFDYDINFTYNSFYASEYSYGIVNYYLTVS